MAEYNLKKSIRDVRSGLMQYRVWFYQSYHSISSKYKRSVLGPAWLMASLVVTSLSISIVFGGIFGQPLREFLPYIASGFLVWSAVAMPMTESPETFVSASHIIRNHSFPFTFYVLELTCRNFLLLLHNLVAFFLITVCVGGFKIPDWTFVPALAMIYLIVSIYGTLTAMLGARYRDIRFIFPYIAQLLFFLTPIFWHSDQIKGPRQLIAQLNPLFHLVQIIRSPLLGRSALVSDWVDSGIVLLVGLALWLIFFPPNRQRIPFWV